MATESSYALVRIYTRPLFYDTPVVEVDLNAVTGNHVAYLHLKDWEPNEWWQLLPGGCSRSSPSTCDELFVFDEEG